MDGSSSLPRTTSMRHTARFGLPARLVLAALSVLACDALDASTARDTSPAAKVAAPPSRDAATATTAVAPAEKQAAPTAAPAAPAPAAGSTEPPTAIPPLVEPSAPVGPRFAVFFREAPRDRWHMFAITSDEPRAMWIVDDDRGGSAGRGNARPTLSPDGRHIAYFDRGKLWVAAQDGSGKQQVTKHRPNQVSVLVGGFSPDGAALLFHQDAVASEEGGDLPEGVTAGFQRFEIATGTTTPVVGLEAFEAFTEDGKVLFTRSGPGRKEVVIRASLSSPIVEETLLSTDASLGFAQLTVSHGVAVWGEMHESSRARMFAARLDGTVRREIMPASAWAQVQWPRFAPDGSQLAYTDGNMLMRMSLVGAEAMPKSEYLTKCASRCDFRWESSRTLLVIDGRDLVRVSIGDDGVAARFAVADDVAGISVAGERD